MRDHCGKKNCWRHASIQEKVRRVALMLGGPPERPARQRQAGLPPWSVTTILSVTLTKSGVMTYSSPASSGTVTATIAEAGAPSTKQEKSAKFAKQPDISASKALT